MIIAFRLPRGMVGRFWRLLLDRFDWFLGRDRRVVVVLVRLTRVLFRILCGSISRRVRAMPRLVRVRRSVTRLKWRFGNRRVMMRWLLLFGLTLFWVLLCLILIWRFCSGLVPWNRLWWSGNVDSVGSRLRVRLGVWIWPSIRLTMLRGVRTLYPDLWIGWRRVGPTVAVVRA